jgi:hypothetical protein
VQHQRLGHRAAAQVGGDAVVHGAQLVQAAMHIAHRVDALAERQSAGRQDGLR